MISFLIKSEKTMFERFQLPDTKCVLIANFALDQYTHYNFPRSYG